MVNDFLQFFGANPIILGIVSICSILGFALTIVVAIRTANTNRILKFNEAANSYNKKVKRFKRLSMDIGLVY